MAVGGPAQGDDVVTERAVPPTALGEPVVVRPVERQSVRRARVVHDAADGQGRHALQPERGAALVDQAHLRAEEAGAGAGPQGDVGGEAGRRIRQPDRRALPGPLVDRLVVPVGQPVADGGVDEALARPGPAVPRGRDLDQGKQAGPVPPRHAQPDRPGGIHEGAQPKSLVRPDK